MGGLRDAMQEVEKMDLKEDIQDFEKAKRLKKKKLGRGILFILL